MTLLLVQVRYGSRRGYSRMLEAFWDEARAAGLVLPCDQPVTGQAFSSARQRLPADTVRALVRDTAGLFDREHGDALRWHGRRLVAVDGKRIFVQASDELRHVFGTPHGAHFPQAHLSTLFDVIARVPLDVEVGAYGSDERTQFLRLLDSTRPGDVLVADRGYPSYEILAALLLAERDFVIRVPAQGSFKAVAEFVAGGEREAVVVLQPPGDSAVADLEPMRLRAVRCDDGKETWVLLTTLPVGAFPAAEIVSAYGLRWRIESFYDLMAKDYFDQGQLHARWADGVRQEVYAQMLFVLITRMVAATAARDSGVPPDRISRKGAVLAVGDNLAGILLGRPTACDRPDLQRLLLRITRARYKPRDGRSFPRRSLRPLPKWGPAGRRTGG